MKEKGRLNIRLVLLPPSQYYAETLCGEEKVPLPPEAVHSVPNGMLSLSVPACTYGNEQLPNLQNETNSSQSTLYKLWLLSLLSSNALAGSEHSFEVFLLLLKPGSTESDLLFQSGLQPC